MRTLTLGVLIVSGGTLAALPFRRYQSAPETPAVPTELSGPAQSPLDVSPPVQPAAESSLADLPAWNPEPAPPRNRQLDIPLTYEDLALPIDQPATIEQRFNATAIVRQQEVQRQRDTALVMPSMETLTLQQREQLETLPAPTNTASVPETRAGGRLASSLPSEPTFQPLPKPEPEVREHHWIRQP